MILWLPIERITRYFFERVYQYLYQQHVFEMAIRLVDPPGGDIDFPRVLRGQVSVCTCSFIAQNVYKWSCLFSAPFKLPSFSFHIHIHACVCVVCMNMRTMKLISQVTKFTHNITDTLLSLTVHSFPNSCRYVRRIHICMYVYVN